MRKEIHCAVSHFGMFSENYWSELPDDFFKPLVELFRKLSAYFMSKMAFDRRIKIYFRFLKKCVQVLQMLYKVNHSRH